MPAPPTPADPISSLREEFRRQLELFYAALKLAPPYDSVEKAVRHLTAEVKALPAADLDRLLAEPPLRWAQFRRSFEASGLHRKHRGIIAGLVRDRSRVNLPPEHDIWLDLFQP